MDPVSIGIAAAALLGKKALEKTGSEVGAAAWQAIQRLGAAVRSGLSPRGMQALDQVESGAAGAEVEAIVVGEIESAARADPGLRAELERLIAEAGQDKRITSVLAVAYDNAKQVNVGGDNSGSITF